MAITLLTKASSFSYLFSYDSGRILFLFRAWHYPLSFINHCNPLLHTDLDCLELFFDSHGRVATTNPTA